MRILNNKFWKKLFDIPEEGQEVINKLDGTKDVVKEIKVTVTIGIPLFEAGSNIRYVLKERGEVSKKYFDMNYVITK